MSHSLPTHVDEHVLAKYKIEEKLGKGAYGIVWRAVDKKTKQIVALKKIFDAFQNETDAQRTFREIQILKQLDGHPNIIRLLNVLPAVNGNDMYIVFEYMEADLTAVIRAGILGDLHKQFVVYQLLKGLKYMHSCGLVHRDLKPSNLLVDSDCLLKICDFGLSRLVTSQEANVQPVLTDYVATRWYRSPEILLGSPKYSLAVDMWAAGCIIAELLLGKPLFPGASTLNQIERVVGLVGVPSDDDVESVGSPYASTILGTLNVTPVTWEEKFPNAPPEAIDLMKQLMTFNPHKRLDVFQALEHPYLQQFHDPNKEPSRKEPIHMDIDDNERLSVAEYRDHLYQHSDVSGFAGFADEKGKKGKGDKGNDKDRDKKKAAPKAVVKGAPAPKAVAKGAPAPKAAAKGTDKKASAARQAVKQPPPKAAPKAAPNKAAAAKEEEEAKARAAKEKEEKEAKEREEREAKEAKEREEREAKEREEREAKEKEEREAKEREEGEKDEGEGGEDDNGEEGEEGEENNAPAEFAVNEESLKRNSTGMAALRRTKSSKQESGVQVEDTTLGKTVENWGDFVDHCALLVDKGSDGVDLLPNLAGAVFVPRTTPDLDSLAAAVGAAALFEGIAASTSHPNPETHHALNTARVSPPRLLADILANRKDAPPFCLVNHQQQQHVSALVAPAHVCAVLDVHAVAPGVVPMDAAVWVDVRPWGASSSLVAWLYVTAKRHVSKPIATLLLSGILSATLNMTSPVSTDWDGKMVAYLAYAAKVDNIDAFAESQFNAKAQDMSVVSAHALVTANLRTFRMSGKGFEGTVGLSVVRTPDPAPVLAKQDVVTEEVRAVKVEAALALLFFVVVDDERNQGEMLVVGLNEKSLAESAFGVRCLDEWVPLGSCTARDAIAHALNDAIVDGWTLPVPREREGLPKDVGRLILGDEVNGFVVREGSMHANFKDEQVKRNRLNRLLGKWGGKSTRKKSGREKGTDRSSHRDSMSQC